MILTPDEYLVKMDQPGFRLEVMMTGRVTVTRPDEHIFTLEWSEVFREVYVKVPILEEVLDEVTNEVFVEKRDRYRAPGYIADVALNLLSWGANSDYYWNKAWWEPTGLTYLATPVFQTEWSDRRPRQAGGWR